VNLPVEFPPQCLEVWSLMLAMVGTSAVTARRRSGSVELCMPRQWALFCCQVIDGDG
jgi:hypothetical protein